MSQHLANELNALKRRVTELETARGAHAQVLADTAACMSTVMANSELVHQRLSQLEDAVLMLTRRLVAPTPKPED